MSLSTGKRNALDLQVRQVCRTNVSVFVHVTSQTRVTQLFTKIKLQKENEFIAQIV